MKRILLSVALLSTMTFASDYNYEVTPVIGYNVEEGNLGLDNAVLYGAEFQYNAVESLLKPELSVLYSQNDVENSTLESDILRIALNGVYEYEKIGSLTPLAKIGMGYETINGAHGTQNSDGAFLDAGIGAKIALAKDIALKLEAVYMLKDGVAFTDNNLLALAGINFSFGEKAQREPEPTPEPQPEPEPIDGDDDNDGVLNSIDECPTTPAGEKVDEKGCKIEALAEVIETKAPACPPKMNLNINFKFDSSEIKKESEPRVEEFSSLLKCTPSYQAEIIGHTDSVGSDAYNLKLSQRRADAVKDMIIKNGISPDRLTTTAKGESEPIATNKTKDGRAQNRRIEASLTEK